MRTRLLTTVMNCAPGRYLDNIYYYTNHIIHYITIIVIKQQVNTACDTLTPKSRATTTEDIYTANWELGAVNRRNYLTAVAVSGGTVLAGCTGSSDDECRTETEELSETIYDEWETVGAGQTWTVRAEIEEAGHELDILAIRTDDGARPLLRVEDPSGDLVLETDVAERIERRITAEMEGRYYIYLDNTAAVTSGQWDLDVTYFYEAETEICE